MDPLQVPYPCHFLNHRQTDVVFGDFHTTSNLPCILVLINGDLLWPTLQVVSSQPALTNPLSTTDGQYTLPVPFPYAFQGSRGLSDAICPSHDHAKTLSLSSGGGGRTGSGFLRPHPAAAVPS
jgi:hypothetical protein